jgi:hypothetical protein
MVVSKRRGSRECECSLLLFECILRDAPITVVGVRSEVPVGSGEDISELCGLSADRIVDLGGVSTDVAVSISPVVVVERLGVADDCREGAAAGAIVVLLSEEAVAGSCFSLIQEFSGGSGSKSAFDC